MSAEAWAAIAAFFAVVVAVLSYASQRSQHHAHHAPNLILRGITSLVDQRGWLLQIEELHNFGPGHARTVLLIVEHEVSTSVTIYSKAWIAAGETASVKSAIRVKPRKVSSDEFSIGFARVTAMVWDVIGRRHEFIHSFSMLPAVAGPRPYVVNARLDSIDHRSHSVRALRWLTRGRRVKDAIRGGL